MIRLFCRAAFAAALAGLSFPSLGQTALEVIALRHRTAEQVLPALRLLLAPGGTLSGHGRQLIVRTSPGNLAELRQVLAAIDRPLRRLQISVRFAESGSRQADRVEVHGRVGERAGRIDARAHAVRRVDDARVDQRLQVLEGGRARIGAAQALVSGAAGTPYERGTGFEVVPRVSGNTVLVEVMAESASGTRGQSIATTTVSAPLGEWFELGRTVRARAAGERGIASVQRLRTADEKSVWLKVEALH